MAILFVCGAECRIAGQGSINFQTGSLRRHWTAAQSSGGAPTIDTSVFRSGTASIRFPAGPSHLTSSNAVDNSVHYFRGYFRLSDATPSASTDINRIGHSASGASLRVTSGGVLQMALDGGLGTLDYSGTLVADEWYGVEMQADYRANPYLVDWRIWRASTGWVDQTQMSYAFIPGTAKESCRIGWQDTVTGQLWWDDVVWGSGTTIDEDWSDTTPKGGEVKIIRPTADGAHSFSASGNFKYENTTNFAQSATDVWSHLDAADMTQTAEYISQNVTSSGVTKYCRVTFPNESTYTDVQGVMPIAAVFSAGTQANEMNARMSDDGSTWTNLFGNWGATGHDVSDTTPGFAVLLGFTPPSGGSWTKTKVDGLEFEFGMSDDISPVPFVSGLAFEVAWLELVAERVPRFTPYPQLLAH